MCTSWWFTHFINNFGYFRCCVSVTGACIVWITKLNWQFNVFTYNMVRLSPWNPRGTRLLSTFMMSVLNSGAKLNRNSMILRTSLFITLLISKPVWNKKNVLLSVILANQKCQSMNLELLWSTNYELNEKITIGILNCFTKNYQDSTESDRVSGDIDGSKKYFGLLFGISHFVIFASTDMLTWNFNWAYLICKTNKNPKCFYPHINCSKDYVRLCQLTL